MKISDLLSPADVMIDVRASNKRLLLQELSAKAAASLRVPLDGIASYLLNREDLGSTGIGRGVAIPHARLPDLQRPYGLLARLKQPIEFDSIDGAPVDIVFVLLLPAGAETEALGALALVARTLRSSGKSCAAAGGENGSRTVFGDGLTASGCPAFSRDVQREAIWNSLPKVVPARYTCELRSALKGESHAGSVLNRRASGRLRLSYARHFRACHFLQAAGWRRPWRANTFKRRHRRPGCRGGRPDNASRGDRRSCALGAGRYASVASCLEGARPGSVGVSRLERQMERDNIVERPPAWIQGPLSGSRIRACACYLHFVGPSQIRLPSGGGESLHDSGQD